MTKIENESSTTTGVEAFRLKPFFSERVWGRQHLRPWYDTTGTSERVGEAWLTGPSCIVETGPLTGSTLESVVAQFGSQILGEGLPGKAHATEFPLLVKLLFPEDKLSVQVHPDDTQAQAMRLGRGKTECWYVLEADPGAAVALGLKPGVSASEVRTAVAQGTMEDLLQMVPVSPGDMIFVDAGTIHAIGPGVVLLETQQMSDTTFRMYDYGRPRELHLDQALAVMKTSTRAGKVAPRQMAGFTRLIEEQYFIVDRFDAGDRTVQVDMPGPGCLVTLAGSGVLHSSHSAVEMNLGQAIIAPARSQLQVEGSGDLAFLRCMEP